MQSYSLRLGYTLAEELKQISDCHDMECIIKGMQQYCQGIPMDQEPTEEEFEALQKRFFERQQKKNYAAAVAFLQELTKKSGVQILQKDALIYEVMEAGHGSQPLSSNDTVLVRYSIIDISGQVIISGEDEPACLTPLDDFLPSIAQAMVGMVEGEKRRIYVHPDLAYGKLSNLSPDGILIIEVLLCKIEPHSK
jgi:FKBP-type peptidyl-prolyl cis-trans isomerase